MKKLLSVILIIVMAFSLAACSSPKTAAPTDAQAPTASNPAQTADAPVSGAQPTLKIQFGHVNPASEYSQSYIVGTYFKDNIEKLSNGSIQVDVISDGQLGGEVDMIEGMGVGTIDMFSVASFNMGTFVPSIMALDLPFLFDNKEEAFSVLDDRDIMGPIEDELYNKWGVKVLGWADNGYRHVLNNRQPVNTADDLKGMKLRLPGTPIFVDTFKALGANPVAMPYSETFTAVQQGTVDGLELSILSYYSSGYHKICKYLSLVGHIYSTHVLAVSRTIWDSLTTEQQAWFEEAAAKTVADERVYADKMEKELLQKTIDEGCIVNDITDKSTFKEAVKGIYNDYREQIGGELIDKILAKVE